MSRSVAVATVLLVSASLGGCAAVDSAATPAPAARATSAVAPAEAPTQDAREGRSGSVVRLRFEPTRLTLADGSHAEVVPAPTVDGLLEVPDDVRKVGWWDGSAEAGDPYGSTVIAGHVDSKTQGLGYFARLRAAHKGDLVTVSGSATGHPHAALRYRIRSIRQVDRDAISADSAAFGQTGKHRLVLITCGGDYVPAKGGYQDNVVIIADPVA